MAIETLIQIRKGTSSEWATANPTLANGEPGFETDTLKLKIGNGTDAWASLSYANEPNDNVINGSNLYLWANFR